MKCPYCGSEMIKISQNIYMCNHEHKGVGGTVYLEKRWVINVY